MRVNSEAPDLESAKTLMERYMVEFCSEYDRCGYGMGQKDQEGKALVQTANLQSNGRNEGK